MTHANVGSKVVDFAIPPPGFSLETHGNLRHEYHSTADSTTQPLRRLLNPSDLTHEPSYDETMKNSGRTKSYAKLAAALGEGLAESIDVSLLEDQKQNEKYHQVQDESSSFFPKVRPLDNYARQSRHIATRLIGSTSSHMGNPDVRVSNTFKNGDSNDSKTHMDHESADPFFSYADTARVLDSLSSAVADSNQYRGFLGSSYGRGGVGISVVEPGSSAPTPPILDSWNHGNTSNISRMLTGLEEARGVRSQPPPSFYESAPNGMQSNIHPRIPHAIVHENFSQSDSSQSMMFSTSGVSSTQQSISYANNNNHMNASLDLGRNELERKSYNQLASFIWSPFSSSKDMKSRSHGVDENRPASRALVIVGTRMLDVLDIKSACDAFGSLLYFRPEFCKDRGLIFLAYHDLRSAIHAIHELKQHIEALAHPRSAVQEFLKNNLEVLFCTSLNASSPADESILLISHLPATVDEKYFHGMIKSYGMTRSIYFHSDRLDSEGHELVACTVEFHDIQDSRQALLELESTNPSGSVTITHRTRTVNERKMGRELLALMAQWRHGDKPGLSFVLNNPPMSVPSTINASNNNGQSYARDGPISEDSSTPGMFSSDSSHRSSKVNSSSSGSPASVHITHQNVNPLQHQINQVVIGPNGQSFVLFHPHDASSLGSNIQLAQPTYGQPYLTGLPLQSYGNDSECAMYQNEGQQVWIQQPQMPPSSQASISPRNMLHHFQGQVGMIQSPGYLNDIPTAPPMSPYYNVRNINDPSRRMHPPTNMPSLSTHQKTNEQEKQYFNGNGMSGSQRMPDKVSLSVSPEDDGSMTLDLNAVKSGADQRTSVMVRNIPNK
jgi:hypothetical protein